MPTLVASGSNVMDGSEDSLSTQTTNGVYILGIDLSPLANSDTVEVRIYTKILSGSTKRLAYMAVYSNVQGEPNKYSVPVPCDNYFEASLKQTAGSNRTIDWEILTVP